MAEKKIIYVEGPDLEHGNVSARQQLAEFATNPALGVASAEPFYGAGKENEAVKKQISEAIKTAIAEGKEPVLFLHGHGMITSVGEHDISLSDSGLSTIDFIKFAQQEYEKAYKPKSFLAKLFSQTPLPLAIAIASCYSEGALMSLPKNLRGKVSLVIDDSELKNTYQPGVAEHMAMLAENTPEEMFVAGILRPLTGGLRRTTLPAVTSNAGVLDGDALRNRVTPENFAKMQNAALTNILTLKPEQQVEAKRQIEQLTLERIDFESQQGTRALIGYLAAKNPYTPFEHYTEQGRLIREFTDSNAPPESLQQTLSKAEKNTKQLLIKNFLERYDSSEDYLAPRFKALVEADLINFQDLFDKPPVLKIALKYATLQQVDKVNEHGWTLLYRATSSNNLETMKLLIEAGADVNAADKDGVTPLNRAAIEGKKLEAMKLLIEARADLNAADKDGWTPLHTAASFKNVEAIKLLIEAGADLSLRTKSGETAEDFAKDSRHTEIAEMLREAREAEAAEAAEAKSGPSSSVGEGSEEKILRAASKNPTPSLLTTPPHAR